MPGGRYIRQAEDLKYEGDWWIDDDGRVAFRCTHHNGRSLNALVSKGADRHMEIGTDGNLYQDWNGRKSNLMLGMPVQKYLTQRRQVAKTVGGIHGAHSCAFMGPPVL